MTASIYGQLADEHRRDLFTAAEEHRRVRLARRARRRRSPDGSVRPPATGGMAGACFGATAWAGGR